MNDIKKQFDGGKQLFVNSHPVIAISETDCEIYPYRIRLWVQGVDIIKYVTTDGRCVIAGKLRQYVKSK